MHIRLSMYIKAMFCVIVNLFESNKIYSKVFEIEIDFFQNHVDEIEISRSDCYQYGEVSN